MQRHGDEPVYSQSALGRDRGMKVKLVTMVVISRLLSVREPQRRLNNRPPGVDGVYSFFARVPTRGAARTGTSRGVNGHGILTKFGGQRTSKIDPVNGARASVAHGCKENGRPIVACRSFWDFFRGTGQ
jgi:hypothetical protein